MTDTGIYKDISERTGGDIYIGVVGPVRTGKSTFIKRFMDMFVLPAITDENELRRATDELPQSAAGKTVMTTKPGFVPERAVRITVGDNVSMNVRLVDCVGYMIEGAKGDTENGDKRMVLTPWSKTPMPFGEAADIGTKKVISEHSTVALVVTTDGSFTDIPRINYKPSEARAISELKAQNKPFAILLNTLDPQSEEAYALCDELSEEYGAPVIPINATTFTEQDVQDIMSDLLYEFPICAVKLDISRWICALPKEHYIITELCDKLKEASASLKCMKDYDKLPEALLSCKFISSCQVTDISMGTGEITLSIKPPEGLFYTVLSEQTGLCIEDDRQLISIIKDMADAGAHYKRLENAIKTVKQTGYGIVPPLLEEVTLKTPTIISQGDKYGVKISACAPTLHMIRVDVETELTPIIGSEDQSQSFLNTLSHEFASDAEKAWATEIFGKTLGDMVRDGLLGKVTYLHDDAREKLRDTLERAINEGDSGMLFILL